MLPGLSAAGMMMAGNRKPAFRNLAALFAGGADGVMIDLTDKTTLFQDANGAAAVVNNGDPIGLALDQHGWGGKTLAAYRAAQPELVTNGDFATDVSGWNLSGASGSITWQAGRMRVTATTNSTPGANRAFTCVVGRWYELSIDIPVAHSNYTSYGIGATGVSQTTYTSGNTGNNPGLFRRFFKATSTTHYVIVYGPGLSGQYIEVESISVKEIDGHHATQTSSARPMWASATNDVQFNGGTTCLITDFYFRDSGNFIAARTGAVSASSRSICGAGHGANNEFGYLLAGAAYIPVSVLGNTQINGAGSISSGDKTIHADQTSTNSELFTDGIANGTLSSTGNMPDAARGSPVFIGAYALNGSPSSYMNGRIKRIVAGQIRVQDIMTAADFHANLIAA